MVREKSSYFRAHPRLFPSKLLGVTIPDSQFAHSCERFRDELLMNGLQKEALAVLMLTPLSAQNKKHQVNRAVQAMGPFLNSLSQEQALTLSFLRTRLKVKEELIAGARALHSESRGDFEKAVSLWLDRAPEN